MNVLSEIGDEEFVPFLQNLGVETYKKSFEWMLNDPDFAGILRWLYNSLDLNNALSAREEYRYIEIEKNRLLSPEELESTLTQIQGQYPGICLPGDQEAKDDMKLEISIYKEKLNVLEKQEAVVKNLIKQNDLVKEGLLLELSQLSSAHHQCSEDAVTAADECTALAKELESITDDVINVIADNLEVYTSCKGDKEAAKRFLTYSPLESYRQSQALFRSHFDVYVSKHLANRQNDITNEEIRSALLEANLMEQRLSEAAFGYLMSQAELSGEKAKLALVINYNNVHPSLITSSLLEAQSAFELLEQEENIIEQSVQRTVEQFVRGRTELALTTATATAYHVRLQVYNSLTHLSQVWQRALSLDKLLYYSLRHELRTLEEFVQFASQLRHYAQDEATAVASRIQSMNEICAEHETCHQKLQSNDMLLQLLFSILGKPPSDDVSLLVKLYRELLIKLKDLTENVQDGFRRKEKALIDFEKSTIPIRSYVWSGCTKQPPLCERSAAALAHCLAGHMQCTDALLARGSALFNAAKNGDQHNLRKIWQWFLTDPAKLLADMKKFGGI